jgi:anti-sigma factor RsiW
MTDERGMHPEDGLDALLDGALSPDERLAVEHHLAGCERCRRLYDTLVATRQLLRARDAAEAPPPELADRLRSALASAATEAPPSRSWSRWLAAAAAVLVVLAAALWVRSGAGPDPLADLVALQATAEPAIRSSDVAALEAALVAQLPFRPRVLDLAMMELRLIGGGVADVAGTRAAWMAYEGPTGRLICVMYPGELEELPGTADTRQRDPFLFRVYRSGDATVVAWQEGELVCVLVGTGDPDAVVALAMGKAMLPAVSG